MWRFDMQNKTPQQRAIVAQKDKADAIRKEEVKKTECNLSKGPIVFNKSIFKKLGIDATGKYNGFETMEIYQKTAQTLKTVWFSSNALSTGIAEKQMEEFLSAIHSNKKVYIYFVIGKSGGGINEVEFQAEVLDIKCRKGGMESPDKNLTPECWRDLKNSIWIMISNIKRCKDKSVDDFAFVGNDRPLFKVLNTNSHFGYIKEIEK